MTEEAAPPPATSDPPELAPLPMAFNDNADDLRQRIIIKMAATVMTMPPITADSMMIRGRDSEREKKNDEADHTHTFGIYFAAE